MIKKITLEFLQPLHLGIGNFGIVAETNIFIMPWQIIAGIMNQQEKYNFDIDDKFDEILEKISVFIPKELEDKLTEKEIKNWKLKNIGTYVSTAVLPDTHGSKENSLHEIEFIKSGNEFVGYIDLRENNEFILGDNIKIEIKNDQEFYLGGEQKYGFGKVKINKISEEGQNNFKNLKLKKIVNVNNINFVFSVFLRLYDNEKGYGKKGIYKGFYGF